MFNTILTCGSFVSQLCYLPKLLELARHFDTKGYGDFYYFIIEQQVKRHELCMVHDAKLKMNQNDTPNDIMLDCETGKYVPMGEFELHIVNYDTIGEDKQEKTVAKLIDTFIRNNTINTCLFDYLMEKIGENNTTKLFLGKALYDRFEGFLQIGKMANTRLHDGKFYKYFANLTYPFAKAVVKLVYPCCTMDTSDNKMINELPMLKNAIEKFVDEYMRFSTTHLNVECDVITCL